MKLDEFVHYNLKSKSILNESWDILSESQRIYIGSWERNVWPLMEHLNTLIEADLTPDQIEQLFTSIETSATQAGDNKTAIGKAASGVAKAGQVTADAAKKVNSEIQKLLKQAQNSGPVKNMDAQFDKLRTQVSNSVQSMPGGDKILQGVDKWKKFGEENPMKQAFIIGAMTSLLAFASGGALSGAAIGFFVRAANNTIKGDQLSTVIGKGVKGAAIGAVAGAAGGALSGASDAAAATGVEASVDAPASIEYTINSGDTLSQIAADNDVSVKDIMDANPDITDPNQIYAGDKIEIPPATGNPTYQDGVGTGGPVSQSPDADYTIKSGDTLSKIAADNNVSIEDLMAANPDITDPNQIYAGQGIEIPSDEAPATDASADSGAATSTDASADSDAVPADSSEAATGDKVTFQHGEGVEYDKQKLIQAAQNAMSEYGAEDTDAIRQAVVDEIYRQAEEQGTAPDLMIDDEIRLWVDAGMAKGEGIFGELQDAAADTSTQTNESIQTQLSETQVLLVLEGVMDKVKGAVSNVAGKAKSAASSAIGKGVEKAKQVGKNITTKVTANKLMQAWEKAGKPTDSDQIAAILSQNGVGEDILSSVYTEMNIPFNPEALQQPEQQAQQDQQPSQQQTQPAQAQPDQAQAQDGQTQPAQAQPDQAQAQAGQAQGQAGQTQPAQAQAGQAQPAQAQQGTSQSLSKIRMQLKQLYKVDPQRYNQLAQEIIAEK